MTADSERPKQREAYVHDYEGALTEHVIAGRTAEVHASFFLRHLRPGMTLLDCGCGPGTITTGFAPATAPGQVIGIDVAESQVEAAREKAAKLGVANVSFECGDVYNLPFDDGRFDAVFSHAMLEHLRDPLKALAEMRRVLKPGGIAGIRCIDLGGTLIAPDDPALTAAHDNWIRYRQHCGGDPFMGRRLRGLLRDAGYADTIGSASSETWATPKRARAFVPALIDEFTGPQIAEATIRMGWADQAQLDGATKALRDWGDHPDAFFAVAWCEAIGRKK